ncbi:RING finger protein 222 [Protopterus annectens]|uniref:RING finger protein 222 n=1 Tax=Protopterus annectens TaxID=7888 RepID=UPI001CFA99DF|nr:RING finger protein 222 [Protopterus annectens]
MSDNKTSTEVSADECPVCYESFSDSAVLERTLSCGHIFCHECLVKTLISSVQEGHISKRIICPVCRYVTFLSKKSPLWVPKPEEKKQILEVPLSPTSLVLTTLPMTDSSLGTENSVTVNIPETSTRNGFLYFFNPQSMCNVNSTNLTSSPAVGSQIFVISGHGRPMNNQDQITSRHNRGPLLCKPRWMILILVIIIFVAVTAAVLPWVILIN